MFYWNFYESTLNCRNSDEVFKYFTSNLKPSNRGWSYFVNWEKVFTNTRKIEIALNNLNYLIGKNDFDEEFKYLIQNDPGLASILPALVVRDGSNTKKLDVLVDFRNKKLFYKNFDFSKEKPTKNDIENYLLFVKETGLKELLVSQKIKNLVDYMIGVEAGLESNARKSRSGKAMEEIAEVFIGDFCNRQGFRYLKEANAKKIKKELSYDVPVDKSSRRYDFVVDTGKELLIFEVNFYGVGGSKLKSTAGEYRNFYDVLHGTYKFIWVTDGLGWKTADKPLRETFDHNDFVFNLSMLEQGILEALPLT